MHLDSNDPIVCSVAQLQALYHDLYAVTSAPDWWHFTPRFKAAGPSQGWKLHLSATPAHAAAMLV